ncbi:membrane dipeptidase (peptidase M19) family protein [Yamadazyma tenuis]|uniref:Dipeptidase n=1 Tax=Candida tenuis (strain ATCC 10573 / BCRC 21748 / CBS 615 / JCM 9827 / NBRC 10315 / NRRL Y-1498 / VKM Y-70) TaxID=590646 RepID=G3BEL5_CANTC|nr:uncharacterized protein CANTEDRAFT_131827 [Yamadazyma tenuis ATCC 10573]EGV59921.1 hypothetical protein CANTEDRAFT_131827 [Yamadazyma tenuis ATCC 10573]WEJ94857.1 membrane dipeptidase (peptidase M19) family protein [Yamadazyma tenuis]
MSEAKEVVEISKADPEVVSRIKNLSKTVPIVDTHNDFPYLLRGQLHYEFSSNGDFDFNHTTAHTDLTRLKEGGVGIQFFSCFIECQNEDRYSQDFNVPNSAVRDTLEQIDSVKRLCADYEIAVVSNSEDALKAFNEGKFVVTMGIEGLHQVDISLSVLRLYYELGVRYATLTHNGDNPFATSVSSVTGGLEDKGLSKFGVECVAEMNRLGMIVDISHVSDKTMKDTLKATKAPVMFSHSSCYGVTPHPRNVSDEVLLLLKKNSGVICINFYNPFITQSESGEATIEDAADHIAHAINLVGWDYVGLGSDFDGCSSVPVGLEDVSKYPELIAKVLERTNGTDEDVAKLMGGNVMRVWKASEVVAASLSSQQPNEANWEDRDWYVLGYGYPELFPGALQLKETKFRPTMSWEFL